MNQPGRYSVDLSPVFSTTSYPWTCESTLMAFAARLVIASCPARDILSTPSGWPPHSAPPLYVQALLKAYSQKRQPVAPGPLPGCLPGIDDMSSSLRRTAELSMISMIPDDLRLYRTPGDGRGPTGWLMRTQQDMNADPPRVSTLRGGDVPPRWPEWAPHLCSRQSGSTGALLLPTRIEVDQTLLPTSIPSSVDHCCRRRHHIFEASIFSSYRSERVPASYSCGSQFGSHMPPIRSQQAGQSAAAY